MSQVWNIASVADCLVPVPVAGKTKVQTRDYKPAGRFPVIDQGQNHIAGWTDDERAVIDAPLPLVVFGDHTRVFKYVNQPFARGADGTQLLRPKPEIDPLFFFYACRAIDLPARGYNRHFTILKEKELVYPVDAQVQKAIAAVLRQTESVMTQQSMLLDTLQELKRAAMRELFTRGLRGEPQKETEIGPVPESWEVVPLGSLGKIGNGSTPKKTISAYWHGGTFPWLTSAKVYDREIETADQFVTDVALAECHLPRVKPGAVLMAITGQGKTLGHCAVLKIEATVSQHVAYLQTETDKGDSSFIRGYLETQYEFLRQVAAGGGSTKGALTCAFLRGLPIPLPGKDEQREIVTILDAIDRKIALHRQKRAVLEELFKALLHKLMTGEIRVADLDLSALSLASVQGEEVEA
ncbi:restriction endonuclease subunit S [uncultured Meiothermus sp.]|jgi:type I restriction enzyme S subunit|uniref:restriction endonuclease subunit S n=1 Tax=uncultured Meiothermus sp. TaxID=157471 RepID=UPI002603FADB|nr:restriction endonuclease subunit S [uncultured Meiothermus sp.]